MDLKQFKTDKQAEIEGRWFHASPTAKLKVARANNPEFRSYFRQLLREYGYDSPNVEPPENVMNEILAKAYAEKYLLDWEGVTEDGEPREYNRENAYRACLEPDFRAVVYTFASQQEAYRKDRIEQIEKNS
jgi:hypothetical protein